MSSSVRAAAAAAAAAPPAAPPASPAAPSPPVEEPPAPPPGDKNPAPQGDKNPPSPVVTPGPAPPKVSPSPPPPHIPNTPPIPSPPPSNPTSGSNTSPAQNPSPVSAVVSTTSTSTYMSIVVTTAADGAIVTSTFYSTIIIYPTLPRRDRDEQFDGTFDPTRIIQDSTGHADLTGTDVTPYSHPGEGGGAASVPSGGPRSPTSSGEGTVQQYHSSQVLLGANILDRQLLLGAIPVDRGAQQLAGQRRRGSQRGIPSAAAISAIVGQAWDGEVEVVQRPHSEHITIPVPIVSGAPPQVPTSVPEDGPRVGVIVQHSDRERVDPDVAVSPSREIPPSYASISGNNM
ncbi:hypothetical protein BJV78DRAFT_1286578 [Lactifluus subvellereus]|nr:hypothetical protein BJV78DRAFT_1286578 [Lactifluus subvellereus]